MEDRRILKVKKLIRYQPDPTDEESKNTKRVLALEDVKSFEFDELKMKKAIFMNDTGRKVFYRVQNMGIIYWDYFTDESRKIRVEIPNFTFYNAMCAFSLPNIDYVRWFGTEESHEEHYSIIWVDDKASDRVRNRQFLLYNLDNSEVVARFSYKGYKKKKNESELPKSLNIMQEEESLFIYESSQALQFLDTYEFSKVDEKIVCNTEILLIQDTQEYDDWKSIMNSLKIRSELPVV